MRAVLVVVSLGGGLEMSWSVLTRYVMHHPYFRVHEIEIHTDGPLSDEQIQNWSGLTVGMPLWEIDPRQVEAHLLTHPWIRVAAVRREFPQRLHIRVSARRPVAIIRHDRLTYLDSTGTCFGDPGDQAVLDLPYVSGLAALPLDTPAARTALAGVLHLLSITRLWQEPLSEISWDAHRGYTLFLARRQVTIRLGWETTPEKLAQISVVLGAWPVDGPAVLFDARFADQVVVRPAREGRGHRTRAAIRPYREEGGYV